MRKTTALHALVLASLMGLAGYAAAMGPWPGEGMGERGPGGLRHMVDALGLTETQERTISEILNSARESTLTDRHRMKALRAQLRDQRAAFDPGEVQAIADEMGQITARTVYSMASAQAQVYQTLDATQQANLDQIMADRKPGPRGRRDG